MSDSEAVQPVVHVEHPATGAEGPLDGVALVTLDRPRVLNALSFALVEELAGSLERLASDAACRVVVITGAGARAFAAGADVRELSEQTPDSLTADLAAGKGFHHWDRVRQIPLPLIAAVRGLALGGGCELAMMCDMIIAGEGAQFGQPEIRLGIIPGAGGTQRLTRAIGRARAMELVLTGRSMTAREAETAGLISRVVPDSEVVPAALELAGRIAALSPAAVAAAKAAVRSAWELPLEAGLGRERELFFGLFGTDDQREGMAAFLEKRPAIWKGR
jgi:enoyl-CoA hydratase